MHRSEPGRVAAEDARDRRHAQRLDVLPLQRRASTPSSTNCAKAAPREIASSPSAPVPANRSSTRAPPTGSP